MESKGNRLWVILALQETCQLDKQMDLVASEIKSAFGKEVEYFLPVHVEYVGDKRLVTSLFDGYVFVEISGCTKVDECLGSVRGNYIQGPLMRGKNYNFVSDKDINRYKEELGSRLYSWSPEIEDIVIPKVGMFRNLPGQVISLDLEEKTALVVFKTRSREVTSNVKILNLVPQTKAESL